jgi:DNA-binding transcriptional regulator/RsmH inhibitor MraZ
MQARRVCTLPKRFRAALGEDVAIVRLPEQTIGIFPLTVWELWKADLSLATPRDESALAAIPARPTLGSVDARGRLYLTAALCEWAGLSPLAPITFVGAGRRVEIWESSRWAHYQATVLNRP